MGDIKLTDLFSVEGLWSIQEGFSKYTGMAAITTDADGSPVTKGSGFTRFCMELTRKTPLGCKHCEECDKIGAINTLKKGHATVYDCHAGLVDFAAPIMVEGNVIGCFIGGQVRTKELDEQFIRAKAIEYGIDPDEYYKEACKARILSREEIEKASVFLTEIATGLSEMALKNYQALKESERMGKIAKSQADFVMGMSMNLEHSMQRWFEIVDDNISRTTNADVHEMLASMQEDGQEMRNSIKETIDYIKTSANDIEINEIEYTLDQLKKIILSGGVEEIASQNNVDVRVNIVKYDSEVLFGDMVRIGQMLNRTLKTIIKKKFNDKIEIMISNKKIQYATFLNIVVVDSNTIYKEEEIEYMASFFNREENTIQGASSDINTWLSLEGILLKQMAGEISFNKLGSDFVIKVGIPQLGI